MDKKIKTPKCKCTGDNITCRVKMRSSTVSFTVKRETLTGRVCPILCALSTSWSSAEGFHQGSSMITWQAATMFRPRLPALSDIIITLTWRMKMVYFVKHIQVNNLPWKQQKKRVECKKQTCGSVLNSFTALSLMFRGMDPSSLLNSIWLLVSERSSKSSMQVHWVKTMALLGAISLEFDPMASWPSFVLMVDLSMLMVARIFEDTKLLSETENGWSSDLGQRHNFKAQAEKRESGFISFPQCGGAGQTFSSTSSFCIRPSCTQLRQKIWPLTTCWCNSIHGWLLQNGSRRCQRIARISEIAAISRKQNLLAWTLTLWVNSLLTLHMVHFATPLSIFSNTFAVISAGSCFANLREWGNDCFPFKRERWLQACRSWDSSARMCT